MNPDDEMLSDKGCMVDLADHLRRVTGGAGRSLVGGIGATVAAIYYFSLGDNAGAATLFVGLAIWCFFVAWLVHRFAGSG